MPAAREKPIRLLQKTKTLSQKNEEKNCSREKLPVTSYLNLDGIKIKSMLKNQIFRSCITPEFLLPCIPPFLDPSFPESLIPCIPPFLNPFFPESLQSKSLIFCLPPFLNPSFPASHYSWIPPFLRLSFMHFSSPASLLSCFPPFLLLSSHMLFSYIPPSFIPTFFPASLLSGITSFLYLSSPASVLSRILPLMHPSYSVSLQSCIHPVLPPFALCFSCSACLHPLLNFLRTKTKCSEAKKLWKWCENLKRHEKCAKTL